MIHSLSAVTGRLESQSNSLLAAAAGKADVDSPPFAGTVRNAIAQIDHLEASATDAVNGLLAGTGVDVHQAMIAAQKASMAFELALAVRNKAVQAYQNVMQMQF